MSPVLEARDLARAFTAGGRSIQALNGVSFTIQPGRVTGLIGPDGAGKTTLMRLAAGLLVPDAGSIRVLDLDATRDSLAVQAALGYMPQRFGLYEDLTVQENIRFYADLFEVPQSSWTARVDRLLLAADMAAFRKRLAGQLSGGMKQKLGLICSLVHTPRVLLLDEPTTGVDPVSRREFWQILYSLRAEGVAILISTAYLDEAERCDRLTLLHAGSMMYCDTPAGLKARMPGAMLEVVAADPRRALAVLRDLPGVQGVLLVGVGVHVHVDAPQRLASVGAALAAAGVAITTIAQVEPSIEDLFVALLDQAPVEESA